MGRQESRERERETKGIQKSRERQKGIQERRDRETRWWVRESREWETKKQKGRKR